VCPDISEFTSCNSYTQWKGKFNPLNAELNPICHLLALLGAHHILHVSRIRVKISLMESLFHKTQLLLVNIYQLATCSKFARKISALNYTNSHSICLLRRVAVAMRSKKQACGCSPAEIMGLNHIRGMDVCLLNLLRVVSWRYLQRADHPSRGVPPTVVRRCVWSRNLTNEQAVARVGPQRYRK